MTTYIRVAELWVPDADGYLLEWGGGLYGNAPEFGAVSRAMCFGRGEGLPGHVWEEKTPIMLPDLQGGYFQRAAAAKFAGLTGAVAFPVYFCDLFKAVVVLFCADLPGQTASIQLVSDAVDPHGLLIPCEVPGRGTTFIALTAQPGSALARRVERWLPSEGDAALMLRGGPADAVPDPAIIEAFAGGIPRTSPAAGLLALPVVSGGAVVEAIALHL